ncbi:MAG: hypothetical protein ABR586_09140 [Thermoplasmatota archaeon]
MSDASGLEGHFVMLYNRLDASKDASLTDSAFQIKARHVRLELDVADYFVESAAAAGPLVPYVDGLDGPFSYKYTEIRDFTGVVINGSASRQDRFAYLFPVGAGISNIEAGCADVWPGPSSTLTVPELGFNPNTRRPEAYVNGSHNPSADISDTLEVAPCVGKPLTVSGSFLVVLWQWDAGLQAEEGPLAIATGRGTAMQPFDGNGGRPYLGSAREAYLYVEDGEFTIAGNAERPTRMYLDQATVRGASRLTLQDGQGQVTGLPSIEGSNVEFTGALDIGLFPGNNFVSANIGGRLQAIDVDGHRVELATAVPATPLPKQSSNLPMFTVTALALAFGGVGLLLRNRHIHLRREDGGALPSTGRAAHCATVARRSLAEGRMPRALRHATRAVRLEPLASSHRVLRCIILQECARQTGRQAFQREAEREEAKLNRDLGDPLARARVYSEATDLLCAIGRREQALQVLRQAAEEDIGVVVQRLLQGGYKLLWDEPWVRSLRGAGQPASAFVDPAFS